MNRVLWMFWFQGFDNAPEVVRSCHRSWERRNPTWEIRALSESDLAEYVDDEFLATLRELDLPLSKMANLLRFYLLNRYGGVWADATTVCCQPLDAWLFDYMPSGFFAFRFHDWPRNGGLYSLVRKGPPKILATWFLAACKGNPLAATILAEHIRFFVRGGFRGHLSTRQFRRAQRADRLLARNPLTSQLWMHPAALRLVGAYPYHILNYHIASIVRRDPMAGDVWRNTPTFHARGPLRLMRAASNPRLSMTIPIPPHLADEIDGAKQPLFKLSWKYRVDDVRPGCIVDYVMRSIPA